MAQCPHDGRGRAFLAAVVAAGFFAAGAVSGGAPTAHAASATGTLHVRVNLQRFQVQRQRHRLIAHGQVVASYRVNGKLEGQTTKAVVMTAQQGTTCRVLHLELGELHLELLGLIVNLVPVDDPNIVLDISADSSEALGKLLCQVITSVSGTTVTPRTVKATRKLNALVQKQYRGGVVNFDTPLSVSSGQATTGTSTTATTTTTTTTTPTVTSGQCEVLKLVLGPLNLDLLGLIVQLNKVQLDISANPVGTLGTLFCQLAGSTSTAATSTTATPTTAP